MGETRVIRKLIAVEIKLGFLHIPASGVAMMPDGNGKISALLDGQRKTLTYNAEHRRIFGLVGWYRQHGAKVGDEITLEKTGNQFRLAFETAEAKPALEEAKALIDISGLSSQAKGNIVEDRIKELVVLQGQGLLSVYRPVTDTQGIDLIVTKNGMFQPLFLQVKSRYNVEESGTFIMRIGSRTFVPHHSYFVVGAYFNPKRLEIDENLLLIPSTEISKARKVKGNWGEAYDVTTSLDRSSKSRWAKFLISKGELANKLLEQFEQIGRYIR